MGRATERNKHLILVLDRSPMLLGQNVNGYLTFFCADLSQRILLVPA
jgi:hypothetical protein